MANTVTTATKVINNLIALGQLIAERIHKAPSAQAGGGKFDYEAFLTSPEFQSISASVQGLLQGLGREDLTAAIKEIDDKRTALLAGKKEEALTGDERIKFAQLGDAKMVLTGKQLEGALDADMLSWLAENALPTLTRIAPLVLAAL